MMNMNTVNDVRSNFRKTFADAFETQSQEGLANAVESYAADLCEALLAEHNQMSADERNNTEVLAQRGVRQLTSAETAYYKELATAMRAGSAENVRSALTNIKVAMPETILDQVMEDVQSEFPLLEAVDFVNSTYMTTWIYNNQAAQSAAWGDLGSSVTKELSGNFKSISATQCKLTAYMVVSHDYLDLGPAWLDRYVRAVLTEACGVAMEEAIVNGAGAVQAEGVNVAACPIGMNRKVSTGTTDENGYTTYAVKSTANTDYFTITDLTPKTYGKLIAKLAKTDTGRQRAVKDLILVVNPDDYYTKVMPATTVQVPGGGYVHDVLPVETKIICSTAVPSGKAVLGIASNYMALLGAAKVNANSKNGIITYDDSVQFLGDNRVYKLRLLGNGRPKDDTSFLYLDISGLTEAYYTVKQKS